MKKQVEVVILSGFLGSGKSTLLTRMIKNEIEKERKIAVLMNELGKVSIDSAIIPEDVPLKEMLDGCICCTIQGELSVQLKELTEEKELDIIYIEATGVAHPLDVLEACTHPLLVELTQIKAVITVINAKQWLENKLNNMLKKLITHQVKFADVILVNKIDQITEKELLKVQETIKEENPQALQLATTYSDMDLSILDQPLFLEQKKRDQGEEFRADVKSLHLKTCVISITQPIERMLLEDFLEKNKETLLRVKGFIRLTESPAMYLLNYAYGYPMYERVKGEVTVEPVLVFIGQHLDKAQLEYQLEQDVFQVNRC
ncbi:CobW family GTP-binding protein [Bacillus sp. FJAT-45037]|uniref:CobW family GTP-binding protein n=1 Tax=Bacillus sp. FJAT-45037 TaxID=2011007 RepID=UPI0018E217E6|nr:GTP-binding protein [Bacillus sp. FJAT-45037]